MSENEPGSAQATPMPTPEDVAEAQAAVRTMLSDKDFNELLRDQTINARSSALEGRSGGHRLMVVSMKRGGRDITELVLPGWDQHWARTMVDLGRQFYNHNIQVVALYLTSRATLAQGTYDEEGLPTSNVVVDGAKEAIIVMGETLDERTNLSVQTILSTNDRENALELAEPSFTWVERGYQVPQIIRPPYFFFSGYLLGFAAEDFGPQSDVTENLINQLARKMAVATEIEEQARSSHG